MNIFKLDDNSYSGMKDHLINTFVTDSVKQEELRQNNIQLNIRISQQNSEDFVQKEKFLVLMVNLKALCSVEKFNQSIINFQRRIFIIMKFELPINVLSNVIVN